MGPYFFPVGAGGDRLHAKTEGIPVILPSFGHVNG
jgi:hypothetical protein